MRCKQSKHSFACRDEGEQAKPPRILSSMAVFTRTCYVPLAPGNPASRRPINRSTLRRMSSTHKAHSRSCSMLNNTAHSTINSLKIIYKYFIYTKLLITVLEQKFPNLFSKNIYRQYFLAYDRPI